MKLPWHLRFSYFLKGLFHNKPKSAVFEEDEINKLGKQIQKTSPGILDYKEGLLLSGFHSLAMELKDAARFFYTALDLGFNRDKSGFIAFLASLEMEPTHLLLLGEASPESMKEGVPEAEMISYSLKAMEEALKNITETQRANMQKDIASLNALKELSSFQFDKLLLSFTNSRSIKCAASIKPLTEMLSALNNILFSLKEPPSLTLLESLFIFELKGQGKESASQIDHDMQELLGKAEHSITAIRDFNKKIPLTKLIRFARKDLSFSPQQIPSGEDWFTIYRDYWKREIETSIGDFCRQKKYAEVVQLYQTSYNNAKIKFLENVASEANPKGFPLPESIALSFLQSFYLDIFLQNLFGILNTVNTEGVFAKMENRNELSEALHTLKIVSEDITIFAHKLSHAGDYGKRYMQAGLTGSSAEKAKKIQMVKDGASKEAKNLIMRMASAILSINNVLGGVLKTNPSIKYGSLVNLDSLGGSNHESFMNTLNQAAAQIQQVFPILRKIEGKGE
jgi:hypothetical protein